MRYAVGFGEAAPRGGRRPSLVAVAAAVDTLREAAHGDSPPVAARPHALLFGAGTRSDWTCVGRAGQGPEVSRGSAGAGSAAPGPAGSWPTPPGTVRSRRARRGHASHGPAAS